VSSSVEARVQDFKTDSPSPKDSSQTKNDGSKSDESEDEILINRVPVLEIWAAKVTSFLYPGIYWDDQPQRRQCLSECCLWTPQHFVDHGIPEVIRARHRKLVIILVVESYLHACDGM
jgi:hypothetical protein